MDSIYEKTFVAVVVAREHQPDLAREEAGVEVVAHREVGIALAEGVDGPVEDHDDRADGGVAVSRAQLLLKPGHLRGPGGPEVGLGVQEDEPGAAEGKGVVVDGARWLALAAEEPLEVALELAEGLVLVVADRMVGGHRGHHAAEVGEVAVPGVDRVLVVLDVAAVQEEVATERRDSRPHLFAARPHGVGDKENADLFARGRWRTEGARRGLELRRG